MAQNGASDSASLAPNRSAFSRHRPDLAMFGTLGRTHTRVDRQRLKLGPDLAKVCPSSAQYLAALAPIWPVPCNLSVHHAPNLVVLVELVLYTMLLNQLPKMSIVPPAQGGPTLAEFGPDLVNSGPALVFCLPILVVSKPRPGRCLSSSGDSGSTPVQIWPIPDQRSSNSVCFPKTSFRNDT